MIRRLFWFLTGAAAGVWTTVKVGRTVRRLGPDSLAATAADRALEAGARARLFARDVRAGMAQRQDELNDALGLGAPQTQYHEQDPRVLPAGRDLPELPARAPEPPASRWGVAYRGRQARVNRKDEH
ncbi:DUF6167 family protein [Actinacidiphila yeochonensis]|uniref:DUF6167 family protein n=1 Tax=Actinacidiphila yeochonensis TaxID=89050 RepID=UPI0007C69333|nr:DUF6167 family protein [Actinacidiphila yeochonensis]